MVEQNFPLLCFITGVAVGILLNMAKNYNKKLTGDNFDNETPTD